MGHDRFPGGDPGKNNVEFIAVARHPCAENHITESCSSPIGSLAGSLPGTLYDQS